jgi:hypothetical protein
LLTHLAAKATRRFHRPNTRIEDTTNEVLEHFRRANPIADGRGLLASAPMTGESRGSRCDPMQRKQAANQRIASQWRFTHLSDPVDLIRKRLSSHPHISLGSAADSSALPDSNSRQAALMPVPATQTPFLSSFCCFIGCHNVIRHL